MLALEERGFALEIASLNPPPNSFRHERLDRMKAEIHYPPPPDLRDALAACPEFEQQLGALIKDHDERYGTSYKARTRAKNAWYFAGLFKKLGVEHVHVHFANRATHSALFLKKLGFSFSFTAHAQDFMFDLGSNDLLAEMSREASFVIAVSDYSKGLLCETCPDSADKMMRIYNGIEVHDFHPTAHKNNEVVRAVSVGRLIEFKGFQHLIGACGLLKKRGIKLQVRVVGEGPMRGDLEKKIMEENVADMITLLGVRSQEEVKRELAEADFFVLPSIFDSVGASDILPTVITEAMACYLPVVSTTVAGIPEMVAEGESGFLVEPADEPALADAMAKVASSAELRQQMGAVGRKRAEDIFTFAVTAGVLGSKFEEISAPEAASRDASNIVYLHDQWDGTEMHPSAPSLEQGVRWLALRASSNGSKPHLKTLQRMELLPDASVIESIWLRRPQARAKLESVRSDLGDAVDGNAFYHAARAAVYLGDVLPKRSTRVLHAVDSRSVLTVWLLKRLQPELRVAAAIEEEPAISRGVLSRILNDFDALSVSDDKLVTLLKKPAEDVLKLRLPFVRSELKLGPFRLKRKKAAEKVDRAKVESTWLSRLKKL